MARDARMVVKADAKAMGAVTAHSARVAPRWQGSKPSDHTSECVSYYRNEDGTPRDGKIFVGKRKSIATKRAAKRMIDRQAAIRLALLDIAGNGSEVD
jgi:hypothetical protein